jgi:ComF family protein
MVLSPPFTRLVAPFDYRSPLPALIAAFKYRRCLVNGRELATCLIDTLQHHYESQSLPAMLVPVPLHSRRLRQRGYNQSLELARWLSGQLAIPVRHDIVARVRHTPQQAGLSAAKRKKNLRGAFRMNKTCAFTPDSAVAIIDDVVTTGTTVSALAKTLLKAGAPEVHVWAIARTCP